MDPHLQAVLAAGSATGTELRQQLGISQPSFSRLLERERHDVAVLGRGRATRYGLVRRVRDLPAEIPVHRVSPSGRAAHIGTLTLIQPERLWYRDLEQSRFSAESDSLPWFMTDMRPQGYLGRLFPHSYPELDLPDRVDSWNEDQALYALARRGEDCVGNLIVGDESLARWLGSPLPTSIDAADRLAQFETMAEQTVAGERAGSSAGGEQPKFTAAVSDGGEIRHVLVKFSPRLDTASGERWADLLLSEHVAGEVLREHGHTTARSQFFRGAQRAFLEVERFDRTGARGRSALVSLAAVDDEFVGERRGWAESAAELLRLRLIDTAQARELRWLSAFGTLIANSDMHLGNVSFHVGPRRALTLAPVYDMLPMALAPVREEVPARGYLLPQPRPAHADQWRPALPPARDFWRTAADDPRASRQFRVIAAAAVRALDAAMN